MNKTLLAWFAILLIFVGSYVVWLGMRRETPVLSGGGQESAAFQSTQVGDFTLTERSGQSFSSQALEGNVVVYSFFFAACPSICPKQNQAIRDLHKEYASRGVKFVSITCDPETDTPLKLRNYAAAYTDDTENWLFLTGDLSEIQRVGKEYFRISLGPQTHSERLVVADATGKTRGAFDWKEPEKLDALKEMLNELTASSSEQPNHPGVGVKWIEDFVLTKRNGKEFDSQELDGQVWVGSFFFATCPTTCVQQNETIQKLCEEFGPQGVRFVSITCDPEKDTPQRLREYAAPFNADPKEWVFLTGDMQYIRRIGAEKFGASVNKQFHLDSLVLFDRQGKLVESYNWHDVLKLREMKAKMKELLKAPASEESPKEEGQKIE